MIKIAKPCDADWQQMQPKAEGKFCSSCEKVVVDFSKMNDIQIQHYFLTYKNEKTCGRFLLSQVNRALIPNTNIHANNSLTWFYQIPVMRSLLLLCASSFLWLSSCVKKQTTLGEPSVENPNCNTQLMGDTVVMPTPEDTTVLIVPKDSLQHEMGEAVVQHEMITGKIRMVDTISQRIKKRK